MRVNQEWSDPTEEHSIGTVGCLFAWMPDSPPSGGMMVELSAHLDEVAKNVHRVLLRIGLAPGGSVVPFGALRLHRRDHRDQLTVLFDLLYQLSLMKFPPAEPRLNHEEKVVERIDEPLLVEILPPVAVEAEEAIDSMQVVRLGYAS